MKSLWCDEWEGKWFIPLRAAFDLELYHLFQSELETLRRWPEPLASTRRPWSKQSGEQFSRGFLGGGNYGREACFLSDLWFEMARALFGKQDPQLWKPWRRVTSLGLTATVAKSGPCVPGILSRQWQSWGTGDSLEPKRPQLSTCQLWLRAGCICRACSASVQEPWCL